MTIPPAIPIPAHPLVIDRHTKKARYATQEDIRWMEAICSSHDAIMQEFATRLRIAEYLRKQLENTYGH